MSSPIRSNLPPKIFLACQELLARGIVVDVVTDTRMSDRGYWRIKIGHETIHGVNTPAALAFLDGVKLGAAQQARLMTIGDWAAEE